MSFTILYVSAICSMCLHTFLCLYADMVNGVLQSRAQQDKAKNDMLVDVWRDDKWCRTHSKNILVGDIVKVDENKR